MSESSSSLLRSLCGLRWLAVAGQLLALLVAAAMGLALPFATLAIAIIVLALFNLYASWRVRQMRVASERETFLHILVDVSVLGWLIAFSGGITNPFVSLFLLPIAFATLALPLRWVWATALACVAGYALSAALGPPLPHVHTALGDSFDVHLWGMAINFLISTAVVLYFFSRLAKNLRQRDQEIAALREQFARNEGIVALATHAASVAHELNTPLATLTLMIDDLQDRSSDDELSEDGLTMRSLVDVCRDRVRELAEPADAHGNAQQRVHLDRLIERWQLVRPTIELHRSGSVTASSEVDPAIGHLLQALLNNAADAGEEAGVRRVDLHLEQDADGLSGEIRDYGAGFDQAQRFLPATLFQSSKPGGMGIGLALSHATVERFGGELSMQASDGAGVCVRFHLPASECRKPA